MPPLTEFVQGRPRLAGRTSDERQQHLRDLGERFAREYNALLPQLTATVAGAHPLHLLALAGMASGFTQSRPGADRAPGVMLQAFSEVIQAFALRTPQNDSQRILSSLEIKEIQDLAAGVSGAFHMRRLRDLAEVSGIEDSRRLFVREQARASTQITRNWAYPDQMVRISRELFGPLDDDFRALWGTSATDLIDMLQQVIRTIETRLNATYARLRPAFQARSVKEMCTRYYAAFPDLSDSPEALAAVLRLLPLAQARLALLDHAALRFPDIFILTLDDWMDACREGTSRADLQRVANAWSLGFGELSAADAEHVFLGNPVWQRPLIRPNEDVFFLPNPALLYSFLLDMLKGLLAGQKPLLKRYEERRAGYLEDASAKLFTTAFPEGRWWRASTWKDEDGIQWENDLLMVVDRVALIVEDKSGQLRPTSRRGGDKSLEDDIVKLRAAPAAQAARFATLLKDSGGTLRLGTRDGKVNEIDVSEVRLFVPVSIVFDQLGPIATQWNTLRAAGIVAEDAPFAPTISLGELEVIFQTLVRPSEKLHYLIRRTEFEQRVNFYGDEMDLLAFYLETGFNIGNSEFDPAFLLQIGGHSTDTVDAYYGRWASGGAKDRPRRRMSAWWSDLVDYIEAHRPPMWSLLAIELLRASEEEQLTLERGLRIARNKVRKGQVPAGTDPFVILKSDPQHGRAPIACVAYREAEAADRHQLMGRAAASARVNARADHAVVIAVNADEPKHPCNGIAYMVPRKPP
ncbi:MAG TPA: hypothetical protein VF584_24150 [Longimicrobium sp.]|jgi:hypothetical protein